MSSLNLLQAIFEEIVPESKQTAVNIQVDISPVNHESELSIQVYFISSFVYLLVACFIVIFCLLYLGHILFIETGILYLSTQVMLQALEVTFDTIFFLNIIEFYQVLQSFTFQQERVSSFILSFVYYI